MIKNHRLNAKKLFDQCATACLHIVGKNPSSASLREFEGARDRMFKKALECAQKRFLRETGQLSKYKPHQGAQECARRLDPNSAAYMGAS